MPKKEAPALGGQNYAKYAEPSNATASQEARAPRGILSVLYFFF